MTQDPRTAEGLEKTTTKEEATRMDSLKVTSDGVATASTDKPIVTGCRCSSCSMCGGRGTIRVECSAHFSPDGYELESCDECGGSGIADECDYCYDLREQDA